MSVSVRPPDPAALQPAVVIPLFNHGLGVAGLLESLCQRFPDLPLIVVDDGSTDDAGGRLDALAHDYPGRLRVVRFSRNRGKGCALLAGFHVASSLGATHALTLDADGRYDFDDLAALLALASRHPHDLILGQRRLPAASHLRRDLARYWLHIQTGQDIPDARCGLRVYPLHHVLALRYGCRRFDFETEVIARLAWAGLTVRSVPVSFLDLPPDQRVSRHRPVADTLRSLRLNAFLVIRRLLPFPFKRLLPRPRRSAAEIEGSRFGAWWKWSSWRNAVRKSLAAGKSNALLSTAIAVGIFIGLTPTFPLQTVISIYVAQRLHLNIVAAVLASQISVPPLIPFWWFLYLQTGHLVLHGMPFTAEHLPQAFSWAEISPVIGSFVVGSMIVAVVFGAASLFLARLALHWFRPAP